MVLCGNEISFTSKVFLIARPNNELKKDKNDNLHCNDLFAPKKRTFISGYE
jgi:hypothetical protein